MEQYIIKGGRELSGEIKVKGAKNHALKVLATSVLVNGETKISNMPQIGDIKRMLLILEKLGAGIHEKPERNELKISTDGIDKIEIDKKLGNSLRASIILTGPMLSRFNEVILPHPGGCMIGKRPIDLFIKGFKALGAEVKEYKNSYHFKAKKLCGCYYIFPKISVTGTETLMMAAVLAQGKTILKNAAQEPEISALAEHLNNCGAKIKGAGTSVIIIDGVKKLNAKNTTIIPDRIEAGTFVVMGLLTNSKIKISDCDPSHLENFLLMIKNVGGKLEIGKNFIKTLPNSKFTNTDIITHEYPGFPTDLQAPFTLLMTQAKGASLIHESIFEGRLFFIDKLNQMGANIIMCDPHRVIVNGPTKFFGKNVDSPDLRAGMTLLLAGLIAEETTTIGNVCQIERGYENIVKRLKKLGAEIYAK
ncbi:MAG: UDP-N-acetylglucosamine 1-carboxyvinyltransferase [Patescibacteria group bacterium]|nr:UDP-N-acetylglucosamine 1-carboxyvinyltransferase [Patescibacteria group bacterium]